MPAGPRKSNYLYTNFLHNFPPIDIPFSREKHPILTKLGVFLRYLAQNTPNLCSLGSFISDEKPPIAIPNFAKKRPKRQAHIRIPCQCENPPGAKLSSLFSAFRNCLKLQNWYHNAMFYVTYRTLLVMFRVIVFLNFILWTLMECLHLLQHGVWKCMCLIKSRKNIIFQNKTLLVMFYRHNKTFWYQICNFKHFLKAENSEDSLASSFCISFHVGLTQYETGLPLELNDTFYRMLPDITRPDATKVYSAEKKQKVWSFHFVGMGPRITISYCCRVTSCTGSLWVTHKIVCTGVKFKSCFNVVVNHTNRFLLL